MYKFGRSSNKKLDTCHPDLQKVGRLAITRSRIDFGIAWGGRTDEEQYQMFKDGKSQCDGRIKKSKHQVKPPTNLSDAFDIYLWHPDPEMRKKMNNDFSSLSYVAATIVCCAQELKAKGEISCDIRWGGNWDMDGIIILDQKFQDLYHFERRRA